MVEKNSKKPVWLVLFCDYGQRKHLDSISKMEELFPHINHFADLGVVDSYKDVQLIEDLFGPKMAFPKIVAFVNKERYLFNICAKNEQILKKLYSITNQSVYETRKFGLESSKTPSAIYFTNEKEPPEFWKSISGYFSMRKIQVSFSTNTSLMNSFDIGDIPQIYFRNSTYSYSYMGPFNYPSVKNLLNRFINKQTMADPVLPNRLYQLNELPEQCLSKRSYCIIHTFNDFDPRFEQYFKSTITPRFKWFVGDDPIPFDFITQNTTWIINPIKKMATQVTNVFDLDITIENINTDSKSWVFLSK